MALNRSVPSEFLMELDSRRSIRSEPHQTVRRSLRVSEASDFGPGSGAHACLTGPDLHDAGLARSLVGEAEMAQPAASGLDLAFEAFILPVVIKEKREWPLP